MTAGTITPERQRATAHRAAALLEQVEGLMRGYVLKLDDRELGRRFDELHVLLDRFIESRH